MGVRRCVGSLDMLVQPTRRTVPSCHGNAPAATATWHPATSARSWEGATGVSCGCGHGRRWGAPPPPRGPPPAPMGANSAFRGRCAPRFPALPPGAVV